jgi:VanZ family protein
VRWLFGTGFWIPLAVCTYLALVPEPPDLPVFRLSDVVLHAAAFSYLTLAFTLMRHGRDRPGRIYVGAFVAMLGYGIFLEVVQSTIPERSAELKDLLVDLVGIGFGLAVAHVMAGPVYETASRLVARV